MDFQQPQNQRGAKRVLGLVLLVAILVVALGVLAYFKDQWFGPQPDGNKYQAVFLTNGQVYFGKLKLGDKWLELNDIYYLQVTEQLQGEEATAAPADQSRINLVKLGGELHGPEDTMHIDRDKVLFWEDLKDDSRVVESIMQSKR